MGRFWTNLKLPLFFTKPSEIRGGESQLINPLRECDLGENNFTELKPFKKKLQAYTDKLNQDSNNIDFVAAYFRDMNNGPWFGINEEATFSPASLLKVPLMIAYYKQAEDNPEILQKIYTYTPDSSSPDGPQLIPPSEVLEDGKSYTVEDLIYRMIVYSDNRAYYLLVKNADVNAVKKIYTDFGLHFPDPNSPDINVTVTGYSGFFRMLFNASYLNSAFSEKALELLAKSEFKSGLAAGLPANIAVAHKFGERSQIDQSPMQLHDCGIVYYPQHPYLLCVMTRGNNVQSLIEVIKSVSKLVYGEVITQFH